MCKLLVIDDCEMDLYIISKLLIRNNLFHHQTSSLDGLASFNEIEKNHCNDEELPDLIFLDMEMPRFNGINFLERFETLAPELSKKIDIFIVTASLDPRYRERTKKYKFVKDYILKPIKPERLAGIYNDYKHSA